MLPAGLARAGGGRRPFRWDGVKVSGPELAASVSAAAAAANGAKNSAFMTSLQAAIGSGYKRKLQRDGVTVWEATVSGTLPIVNNAFVLPSSASLVSIIAADIDSGVWVHRIEGASNPAKFIATRVTAVGGGGPATLSGDLAEGGSVSLGDFTLFGPSLDTAPVVTTYPGINDSRRMAWTDPAIAWASQPVTAGAGAGGGAPFLQVNTTYQVPQTVRNTPEPGIIPTARTEGTPFPPSGPVPAGEYTLARVTHPDNPAKLAFLHRIDERYLQWGSPELGGYTMRSQYWAPSLLDNTVYWSAFSFRPGSDMGSPTPTGPGEGLNIWDVHTSGGTYPRQPIETFWAGGNSIRLEHFGQYTVGQPQIRTISWTSTDTHPPLAVNTWYHLIYRFRVAKSSAGNPFIQAWFAVGNGPLTQVVNRSDIMMGFHNMNTDQCYPKIGLYRWVFDVRRTAHMTGLYVFREGSGTPTLDQNTLHALLMDRQ